MRASSFFVVLMFISGTVFAADVITDFSENSVPILNEEIRDLGQKSNNASGRLDTLEATYAADTASSDTYVISLSTAPASYTTGMVIYFKAVTANTGACTINVNNLGAKSLKSLNNQDPADNYIEAGSIVQLCYDGTNFQILSPDNNP